ncbi:MAG TPA: pitrilysin family protein [Caldisericia bacterium]|mgnify:FL=1|nr:pitrilysin family protein [Caldisericia bacterium]HOC79939.1 pitrilysin family protein [Caldisericia bacterium]HOG69896.1 pitrilysin family protein [Caldisericia bacterium]HPA65381.1 pitrilysin family protein [Caldisericia bacterium]HQL67560.1 pitrilysin family protein [Caldisericia bacterium]
MKLVVDTMPDFGSVALGLFMPVGAYTESEDQQGLSHFLEHLVFKGTPKRSAGDIAIEIDGTGGELNAYTSVELTSFYAKVLVDDVDLALDLLFDITYNPSLQDDSINLERGVVLSEIAEFMDAPDEIASVRAFQAAWGTHPLARSVLGFPEVIKEVSPNNVRKYHKDHYKPENTVLSACGGITYEQLSVKLEKLGIPHEPLNGKTSYVEDRPEFKPNKLCMDRDSEQVYFTYVWPGPTLCDAEMAEALVSSVIIAGSISSRLFQRLREKEGLVYNISMMSSFSKSAGLLGVYGAVPKENYQKSRDILLYELDNLRNHGVTEEELERAKRMIKGSTTLSLESNMARMDRSGKFGLLLGQVPSLEETLNRIDSLGIKNFNNYIKHNIPEDYAISLVGKGICNQKGFVSD